MYVCGRNIRAGVGATSYLVAKVGSDGTVSLADDGGTAFSAEDWDNLITIIKTIPIVDYKAGDFIVNGRGNIVYYSGGETILQGTGWKKWTLKDADPDSLVVVMNSADTEQAIIVKASQARAFYKSEHCEPFAWAQIGRINKFLS